MKKKKTRKKVTAKKSVKKKKARSVKPPKATKPPETKKPPETTKTNLQASEDQAKEEKSLFKKLKLLPELEDKLGWLADSVRPAKNGETKLLFFINPKAEIVAFLQFGFEKLFYWGKVEGNIFTFDRDVKRKFLPNGQTEFDFTT